MSLAFLCDTLRRLAGGESAMPAALSVVFRSTCAFIGMLHWLLDILSRNFARLLDAGTGEQI